MKKHITLVIIMLLFFNILFSQDYPPIQTDRPDQTECPFITPKKYFQIENGFIYEKWNVTSAEIIVSSTLTRFGINDNFELRFITEQVRDKIYTEKKSGFNPIQIGFKTHLLTEKGLIPVTSFIAHISIPIIASKNLKTPFYAPEFRFTMQHTISNRQTLSYNLGAEWNGDTAAPTFIYTLTTSYSITEKIGVYIELYGFVPQIEKPDHRSDVGLTYLCNPNHQLDISGGLGFSKISPKYFLALGYSFRFKI